MPIAVLGTAVCFVAFSLSAWSIDNSRITLFIVGQLLPRDATHEIAYVVHPSVYPSVRDV